MRREAKGEFTEARGTFTTPSRSEDPAVIELCRRALP